MPRRSAPIFPRERDSARALGQRLREARLRRRIPLGEVAARVGVDRRTQRRLEQGDPSVGLGTLVRTLAVLGLSRDLDAVAANDETGRRLADLALSDKPRRSRPRIS